MFNVTATIKSIDYNKLIGAISESMPKEDSKSGAIFAEVLKIVKPFAGQTLKTIPPSAIVGLFDLLVRDKIVDMAEKHGVKISSITLKHSDPQM